MFTTKYYYIPDPNSGGGGSGVEGYIGNFDTYADLPVTSDLDDLAVVLNVTGDKWNPFTPTYRASGWYKFNGVSWEKMNDILTPDNDPTLSANSSTRVATQQATKAYVDSKPIGGQVDSVVGGTDISVDNTDPINPIVNYTGTSGDMLKSVYDTNDNGIVDNSENLQGNDSAYHLDRSNHTGTQTASTISDFDTEVSNNADVIKNKFGLLNGGTGIYSGGIITINVGDNTKFDVSSGSGVIWDFSDPANPIPTNVSWSSFTAESVPDINNDLYTTIIVDSSGSLVKTGDVPTSPEQRRQNIQLGTVVHTGSVITSVADRPVPVNDVLNGFIDFINANGGALNGGGIKTTNPNLTFVQQSSVYTEPYINYHNNPLNPSTLSYPESNPKSFIYSYRDGLGGYTQTAITTNVNPDEYDDGSGTLQSMPNTDWTFQPVYYFPTSGFMVIVHGQFTYNNKNATERGISLDFDEMVIDPQITSSNGKLLGFFVLQDGATDLTNQNDAEFVTLAQAVSSGSSGGSGGGAFNQLFTVEYSPNTTISLFTIPDSVLGAGKTIEVAWSSQDQIEIKPLGFGGFPNDYLQGTTFIKNSSGTVVRGQGQGYLNDGGDVNWHWLAGFINTGQTALNGSHPSRNSAYDVSFQSYEVEYTLHLSPRVEYFKPIHIKVYRGLNQATIHIYQVS